MIYEGPNSVSETKSIWQELEKWSGGFASWQKLLLSAAIRHGTVPQTTIDQCYRMFLVEHALAKPPEEPPDIPTSVTGRARASSGRTRLHRIHSLQGVNRLPAAAELQFGTGLTVIYGGNGVGKSGFARVLANACFSRSQHPIYPDVFDESAPKAASAVIEIIDEGDIVTPLTFDNFNEIPALRRGFAVFDSAVAQGHLRDASPLGFTPTGFDVFSEMARCYGALQTLLAVDTNKRSRPNSFGNAFIGPATPASEAASKLSRLTALDYLRALASFGPDEEARIGELQAQSDDLRRRSPDAAISRLQEARRRLAQLKLDLTSTHRALSEEALAADRRLLAAQIEAATRVANESAKQFSMLGIEGIGSSAWKTMISSAGALTQQQHVHYPGEGDLCLLCQQPLEPDARELFVRYSSFLQSDAPKSLSTANGRLASRVQELRQLPTEIAADGTNLQTYLRESHPSLAQALSEHAAKQLALRDALIVTLEGGGDFPAAVALPDFSGSLDEITARIERDIERLKQSDIPASYKAVEEERTALRHRQVLAQNVDAMVEFVLDSRWVAKAEAARADLNPRHLTEKQTELFSSVVATKYRKRLAEECVALDCNVPVQFRTQGRQGQTIRSLFVGDRTPDDILSEGEQRAVALADFLTEVGLNDENAGIILDDPVTSLDHDRKDRIAARLVDEARKRQVIVFTHDMVFYAKICDAAHRMEEDIVTHWIHRDADGRPGRVAANDGPTTTPQYRTTNFAEDSLAMAKASVGSVQEQHVRRGAAQLRRTVEEIIPQYLLKEVVRRWTDRVMVTALRRINWDNSLVDGIIEVFEECSAIMEGHSHTEGGVEAPPTPAKLESLITRTKELIRLAKIARQ